MLPLPEKVAGQTIPAQQRSPGRAFMGNRRVHKVMRRALLAAASLQVLAVSAAVAQTAPAGGEAAPSDQVEEIVVTGIRQSLQRSTEAKREAVAFGDSIYAE